MKTYTADQLIPFDAKQIDNIQKSIDKDVLNFLNERKDELSFLSEKEEEHLYESFSGTMDKYWLMMNAIASAFSTHKNPGFPENIYNIDLSDGSIETDKNGRHISYPIEILAPCTTAMLQYIDNENNDVFVVCPPLKSEERTVEKLITECVRECEEKKHEEIAKFADNAYEDEPELPFPVRNEVKLGCGDLFCSDVKAREIAQNVDGVLLEIAKQDRVPKDIYRVSVTSKYPGDLEDLIKNFEEKFPSYIKFEKGERNQYKKNLSENKRVYLDIKKTAKVVIPDTNREFFIEFQFKQTNMFFAHIRSHKAYEEYRILEAKYLALVESEKKRKTPSATGKAKLQVLKKQCEDKKNQCVLIHRNAVHQSNLYLMRKLLWLDDNARGLRRTPEHENGQYDYSIMTLKKNYIVENYEPFDGATAFMTSQNEYLNKCYYLKLIGVLPESFDELGKSAKEHISKSWNNLTPADVKEFMRITSMAIKYQDVIRGIQKERRSHDNGMIDNAAVLDAISQNAR